MRSVTAGVQVGESLPRTRGMIVSRTWYLVVFMETPPYIMYLVYVGWAGVGWRRRCKTRLSPRELDNQGTVFSFWVSPRLAVESDHCCAARTLTPHKRGDRMTYLVPGSVHIARHRRGSYISIAIPLLSLDQFIDAVIHFQESPPRKRCLVGCTSPFMRLAQHLTALRTWCEQCLPGR